MTCLSMYIHRCEMIFVFYVYTLNLTVSHCSKDLENKLLGKAQAVDTKNINSIKSMIRKGSIFFFNITQ